jgi:2-dehydro-3-deoxyphosphogluconate aldolase/(4S)-4-hydroxy-2-oxoglutarate aldolase
MKRNEVCVLIKKLGILPAVRVSSGDDAHFAAEAITQGGIPIVEITLTVPDAVKLISHLVQHHPKVTVGAGLFSMSRRPASAWMRGQVS